MGLTVWAVGIAFAMENVVVIAPVIAENPNELGKLEAPQVSSAPSSALQDDDQKVETESEPKEIPEILIRIADCESGNSHYEPNGEVKRGKINPNDIGRFQISATHWLASSSANGIDIFSEEGNEEWAVRLYGIYGAEPWWPSAGCWDQ